MTKRQAARLLGVRPSANRSEILRAWRERARETHPDKYSGEREKAKAHERFVLLLEARDFLLGAALVTDPFGRDWAGFDLDLDWDEEDEDEDEEEEEEDEEEEDDEEEEESEPSPWDGVVGSIDVFLDALQFFYSTFDVFRLEVKPGLEDLHAKELSKLAQVWVAITLGQQLRPMQEALDQVMTVLDELESRADSLAERMRRAQKIRSNVRFVDDEHCLVSSERTKGVVYHVDLRQMTCDCPDFTLHEQVCKHILAVLLRQEEDAPR